MARFFSASDIVKAAVEIERRGRSVYSRAAANAPDADLKRFLEFFAAEEARHQTLFEGMLGRLDPVELPAGSTSDEYMEYVQALLDSHALFAGEVPEHNLATAADVAAAIELAMRFEKDTILFFSAMRDLLPAAEQSALLLCLEEERSHLRQLRNMLGSLQQG